MKSVLGAILGWLVGSFLRIRRAHVEHAMERAGLDPALAPLFYRSLGRSTIETLAGAEARADERSLALFREALARGRGVVIAASHTGNFEIAARYAATLAPLLAITKRQSVKLVDWLVRKLRRSHGILEHEPHGAMKAARAHLATGGAVAMIIDQVPRHRGIRMPFLNGIATVDRAPAVVAARAGCPMVVTAAFRDESGVQQIRVLTVIEVSHISGAMRSATRALEAFVLAHPTEWLWMHRRWKQASSEGTRGWLVSSSEDAAQNLDLDLDLDRRARAAGDGASERAVQDR